MQTLLPLYYYWHTVYVKTYFERFVQNSLYIIAITIENTKIIHKVYWTRTYTNCRTLNDLLRPLGTFTFTYMNSIKNYRSGCVGEVWLGLELWLLLVQATTWPSLVRGVWAPRLIITKQGGHNAATETLLLGVISLSTFSHPTVLASQEQCSDYRREPIPPAIILLQLFLRNSKVLCDIFGPQQIMAKWRPV